MLPPPFVGGCSSGPLLLPDLAFEGPGDATSAAPVSIFVGNIDSSLEDIDAVMLDLFTQMGDVVSVRVPREKGGTRPRGFAFCDFADARSAQYAVAVLQGLRVGSRCLRLEVQGGASPAPRATVQLPPLPQQAAPPLGTNYDRR
ncbi:hypothetical protein T492DRAFT_839933 [Pavlovales sp. CCMP2436]|nr:hypothetical protein T492DRAFT_839933 [Pavlovales sp. CCMP2436]|mmetsp:Transcript_29592/g.74407  ORF Transcript_29592/g.74407 Transcript_29592/m.74407 type:complete len:144 (-) Transcript_29592:487-918(-)